MKNKRFSTRLRYRLVLNLVMVSIVVFWLWDVASAGA